MPSDCRAYSCRGQNRQDFKRTTLCLRSPLEIGSFRYKAAKPYGGNLGQIFEEFKKND